MSDENSTPFLDEIKAGYTPGVKNVTTSERLFDLIKEEAESLTEVGEKADEVASAARRAMNEVLRGGQVWTTVLESVQKKLQSGSGNLEAIRELALLQVYVKENLPTLSQGKLELSSENEQVVGEKTAIVTEVQKMVMESLEGELVDTSKLPPRVEFVQNWAQQVDDLKRRLGVTGDGMLSTAIGELTNLQTSVGIEALSQVNKRYSRAKIEAFVSQFKTKSEEDAEEISVMSPQGEIYAAFLHQQLADFHAVGGEITQQQEHFLNYLFAGIGGGRSGTLSEVLLNTPNENKADRAAGEAVKMAIEGGTLNDYLTALSQMDAKRREAVFNTAFTVWEELPGSKEEKQVLAKLILIAHDAEIDDDRHGQKRNKLLQIIQGADLDSLRREAKTEIINQTMGDLKNELFIAQISDPSYRVNISEKLEKLVSNDEHARRQAAATLAKQEIVQTIIMSLIEKTLPHEMSEAQQQIGEVRSALRQSRNLERTTYGQNQGFSLRLEGSKTERQALENQKSIVFLASYLRTLLSQPQHERDAVELQTQYFLDAEKFGVKASTLIELHNQISTTIAAYNRKIEKIDPISSLNSRAPIEFTDYLMRMKDKVHSLPIFKASNFEAKGLKGYGWDGKNLQNGYVCLYTSEQGDVQNTAITSYIKTDAVRFADGIVDQSQTSLLLSVGVELGKIDAALSQHEGALASGKLLKMYEDQTFYEANKYDNVISHELFVKNKIKEAETLVAADSAAIISAVDKLSSAGKEGDELKHSIERWEWNCDRDYEALSLVEKSLIRIGQGRSEYAKTKHKLESKAASLIGGEKFNLIEPSERQRLMNRLEQLKITAQTKYATEIATQIKVITGRVENTAEVAKRYVDSLKSDAETSSLTIPDYSGSYRQEKTVAVKNIDAVSYDERLQIIYRTVQKSQEAYGRKVYALVNNLLANRGVFNDHTKVINEAIGELRLKLGYKNVQEYSYGSHPESPAIDLSAVTELLTPILQKARKMQTEALTFDIKPEAIQNIPGSLDKTPIAVINRIKALQKRRAALLEQKEEEI